MAVAGCLPVCDRCLWYVCCVLVVVCGLLMGSCFCVFIGDCGVLVVFVDDC